MVAERLAQVLVPLIPAGFGLLGVTLGGWSAFHNQKKERTHRFFRKQLAEFYARCLA